MDPTILVGGPTLRSTTLSKLSQEGLITSSLSTKAVEFIVSILSEKITPNPDSFIANSKKYLKIKITPILHNLFKEIEDNTFYFMKSALPNPGSKDRTR